MMKKRRTIITVMCACLLAESLAPMAALAEERPEYTALDYVELGDYIGMTVQVDAKAVTDEDVLTEAKYLILEADAMESADTAEEGDIVNIDYAAEVDGETLDGGSSEDEMLELGSGVFIEGFEEGLIGAKTGETVKLELTFPDDFYYESVAGEDVVYTVKVNEILRMPELTEDLVSAVTHEDYTDADEWLSYIRSQLEKNADTDWDYEVQKAILGALAEESEITGYPEDLLDYTLNQTISYYEEMAETFSMSYEDFIAAYDYTPQTFEKAILEPIKASLEEELLLMAVAEQEDITLSEEEYQDGIEKYAAYYGYDDAEAFESAYAEAQGEDLLRISLTMDKVFDFLEENSEIRQIGEDGREEEPEKDREEDE